MPSQPKTVFLHVGSRKSGTSHLQFGLQRSRRRLARAGLFQPLGARGGTMRGLLLPLRGALDGDVRTAEQHVSDLARTIRDSEHPRHLVTLEALAELPGEATSLVVAGLAEFDLRLVVTTRSWALTIPSEWQQQIKSRYTGSYPDYAEAIREPGDHDPGLAAEATRFRHRQDAADVVTRWRAHDPGLPASVILVPSFGSDGPSLEEMFCGLVGVDPDRLSFPQRVTNESLSHADAELLRLVNLSLGDRLDDLRGSYRHHVRKWLVAGSLMRRPRRDKIRLPRSMEQWCTEESGRQLAALDQLGCQVLGDREGYLHPRLPGDDFTPATDHELVTTAAEALADLADLHARETRKWKRQLRRARTEGRPAPPPPRGRARRGARALAGRVVRRLRPRR